MFFTQQSAKAAEVAVVVVVAVAVVAGAILLSFAMQKHAHEA
jgi:hypothetical protein